MTPAPLHYHWQWADTFQGGRNIDIFEGRKHIAITFTEKEATRIISALYASHTITSSEREKVLDSLDKEIRIREDEMNRKAGLEENLVTISGYYASAGALNWVRVVLIEGLRDNIIRAGNP